MIAGDKVHRNAAIFQPVLDELATKVRYIAAKMVEFV